MSHEELLGLCIITDCYESSKSRAYHKEKSFHLGKINCLANFPFLSMSSSEARTSRDHFFCLRTFMNCSVA